MSADPTDFAILPSSVQGYGIVPGLVWAFRVHRDGTAEPLAADQPIDGHHDGWVWLHLNLADVRAVEWIHAARLPAAAAALLVSHETHQQMHAEETCVYGVFADVVQNIGECGDEFAHLHFVMTERLLVSGRHHALSCVEAARNAIERGARRLPNVAALLELIVEHVADAMDKLAEGLSTSLDHIEDGLAARAPDTERPKLARSRRTAVRLHRQLTGLRILFHRIEREGFEGLKPQLRIAAAKIAQRLDALDHEIVALRDRARLLQEEVTEMTAEITNRHLYVLSILTTLFLPPTLVTGIFGMNTKGLPFTENEDAFLWAAALMLGSAIGVYLVMRRVGVFKL